MNLRQKAKKYKQRCEQLEAMVYPTKNYYLSNNHNKIITLETQQIMDIDDYYRMSAEEECYASRFNKILAANLLHEILNYADITTEYCGNNKQIVKARIKVIDMSGREE